MAKTRAQENKAVRQEALREQLSAQGHVQHVIDLSDKLIELSDDLDQVQVARLKAGADIKLKLISKYLPDLKQSEITIEADVVAKEKTRKELEDKLLSAGIDLESL